MKYVDIGDLVHRRLISSELACFLCGRPLAEEVAAFIELGNGGAYVIVDASDEDRATEDFQAGYLGEHPVGPECIRKVKARLKQT